VAKVGAALGIAASAGLALRGTLKVGASFESVMSELAARTGATGDEFKRLQDRAEELGRATIFDGDAAGKAMIELTKAGFSTEQTLAAVGDVLNLATAEGVELADAAGYVAGALKKFELGAADAGRVTDILSQGAGAALTDISTLSEQLAFAAGPARNAGKSIEETVAAIGALSDKVDKGVAGTGLQQIFAKMAKPTAEAQRQLDKLGLSFTDNAGRFKDLATIVDEFNAALDPLTDSDRARALNTIFESRSGNAFSGLLSAGGDDLRARLDEIVNAGGRVDGMAKTMQDNVSGAFKGVMSAVKGFATDVFQIFGEPLKDGLNSIANTINGPLLHGFVEFVNFVDRGAGAVNQLLFGFRDFSDEGISLGSVFDELVFSAEFFFKTFETQMDLAGAKIALATVEWSNAFLFLFTEQIPWAIKAMVVAIDNSLADTQEGIADWLLGLHFNGKPLFAPDHSPLAYTDAQGELKSMQTRTGIGAAPVRQKSGTEFMLESMIKRMKTDLRNDKNDIRDQRERDARNREITKGFEKAGRDAWAAMMGDGNETRLPRMADASGSRAVNTGIKATERLAGPELATRGSKAAYDAIYRAIRGSSDRAWQNNSLDALQQIANNTAQQPIDEVVTI
jgi:TP901 family phage tail tape measure protein